MQVTLLGASGFIGRHLADYLRGRGDTVLTGSLRPGTAKAAATMCAGSDVVVNLAGAAVAKRWTVAYKAEIRSSRVDRTRELIAELGRLSKEMRPKAYVVSSAIGYYGTSETATFTEQDGPGSDFLAEVCFALEKEAQGASSLGMRLTILRIGIVLGVDGGALKALLPIYTLGLGGPIASGRQWMSWIHIADQVGLFAAAIDGASGTLNGTAPHPVANAVFTKALGRALNRPAILPTPAFAIRMALGGGEIIVTEGQRVLPARTQALGYEFQYATLEAALESLIRDSRT